MRISDSERARIVQLSDKDLLGTMMTLRLETSKLACSGNLDRAELMQDMLDTAFEEALKRMRSG